VQPLRHPQRHDHREWDRGDAAALPEWPGRARERTARQVAERARSGAGRASEGAGSRQQGGDGGEEPEKGLPSVGGGGDDGGDDGGSCCEWGQPSVASPRPPCFDFLGRFDCPGWVYKRGGVKGRGAPGAGRPARRTCRWPREATLGHGMHGSPFCRRRVCRWDGSLVVLGQPCPASWSQWPAWLDDAKGDGGAAGPRPSVRTGQQPN
jgi:hypothetical protein